MTLSVLGSIDVRGLRPRDRVVLAALAVRHGAGVSADELADACWGADPPGTWWQQVKTSVAAIRAELGADAVRTDPHGYGLGLDPGGLDSVRFERLVEAAREQVIRNEPDRAVEGFHRALELWRGNPFEELPDWAPARIEAMRLVEIRSTVEEELLEARLASGRADEVVADAERLVREQPLREARWAILALAQYRADRQADALAVLRRARAQLVDALGVEPGPRLSALEVAVLRQDPSLAPPDRRAVPWAECPYPGLQAFGSAAADRFFGRDAEIDSLLDRLRPGRAVAVVGPSGSGKSSVLLGGLLPVVAAGTRTCESFRLDAAGVAHLAGMARVEQLLSRPAPDVLAIDQFEELFLLDPEARERICRDLARLLEDGVALVVTLRSDFLDRATALPHLGPQLGDGVFALGPLTREGLRKAVELPARAAGLRLEPGLVELILRDAEGRATALPHLAHALVETWRRREGAALTVEGYETSGGIAGAIANSAEERYQTLSPEEQQSCRSLLMRLLERDAEGGVVRRRIVLAALLGDARRGRVIEQLVASRLLAVDGATVGVAHEAVARAWPRLDAWLVADAESAAMLRRLEEGAAAWDATGRSADDLPRGARAQALLEWRDQTRPDLTPLESAFLHAAAELHRAETNDLARRAATERRQNRRLRQALAGAAALLVVTLIAGGLAVVRERDATTAQADARVEALAAVATSLVGTDRDAGALLAAELYRRHPTDVRVRSALMALLTAPGTPDRKIFFPADQRIFAAPIPGTDHVLVAADGIARSSDGHGLRLSIWDLGDGTLVRRLPVRLPDAVTYHTGGLHVRPDGVAVAAYPTWESPQSCCGTVVATVDLNTGRLLAGPKTLSYEVADHGVFVNDGRTLALRTGDSAAPVWLDVATLRDEQTADHEPGSSEGAAIAGVPGGEIAVAATNRIDRFDPKRRAFTASTPLPADLASNDVVSLGDGSVLTSGPAGTARIDLDDGHVRWRAGTSDGSGQEDQNCDRIMVLAARGTFLCSAGTTWEARLSDGRRTQRTFPAQAEWIDQAALVDGALMIVNQRTTPFLERFPVDDSGPISTLVAPRQAVVGGFVDARTIVAGAQTSTGDTGGQYLWDITTRRQTGPQSDFVDALGGGFLVRYSAKTDRQMLSRVGSAREWPMRGGVFAGSVLPRPGSTDRRAFAVLDDFIQPFDPRTGRASGPALDFSGKQLKQYWVMVHDAPGTDRALVSWWDVDRANMTTAVFDLKTGKQIVRGLSGDVASVLLPGGDVISTTSTELRRSTPLLDPVGSLPKPVAGANLFELSADGTTLLLEGIGQPAALYDLPSGKKLGNDIRTNSPEWDSAHLSPDGRTLVTNAASGVIAWDLDPGHMARAACAMAGRSLTATEWRGAFGDEPQVDTCHLL